MLGSFDTIIQKLLEHQPDCGPWERHRQAIREVERTEDLAIEQGLAERWQPKTLVAARVIPFDISLRIDRFAERHESFPRSRATINRRGDAAAEAADFAGNVYSHCLRATAASFHAY